MTPTPLPRTNALVQVKLTGAERSRWAAAAAAEHLRVGELVRLAVRHFVRDIELRRLLAREHLLGQSHAELARARPRAVETEVREPPA